MASKNFRKILFFLIFLIFFDFQGIFAQNSSDSENQVHFSQKISWSDDENAFEYKVELENLGNGRTETFTTEENSLTFSKPAGNYRYRVAAVDFLGREGEFSSWQNFTITKAVQPKIISLSDSSFKADENEDSGKVEIAAETEGVNENSTIVMIDENSKEITNLEFEKNGGDEKFVAQNAEAGTYTVKITNPGGLETQKSGLKITKDNSAYLARIEAERRAAEEAEKARIAEEKRLEEERIAAENAEKERIAAEEAEKARIAEEKRLEEERIAAENAEKERIAAEEAEKARIVEEKRLEEERIAAENAEKERIAAEEAEKARIAEEKRLEEERIAAENAEKEARKKLLGGPEFFLGAGYALPFELLDGTIEDYTGRKYYPLSGTFRTSFVFLKSRIVNLGLGIDANYARISGKKDETELSGNFASALGVLVLQRPLVKNHLNLELHAGAGIGMFQDLKYTFPSGRESEPLKTWDPAFGGGIALQYIFLKHFYTELGVDYVHCLFNDLTFGILVPSVSVGIRLN